MISCFTHEYHGDVPVRYVNVYQRISRAGLQLPWMQVEEVPAPEPENWEELGDDEPSATRIGG